jgi:hypothetical protein
MNESLMISRTCFGGGRRSNGTPVLLHGQSALLHLRARAMALQGLQLHVFGDVRAGANGQVFTIRSYTTLVCGYGPRCGRC